MTTAEDYPPCKAGLEPAPWLLSSRLGLALISFFVLMSMTSQRASMYVAIPCMVNQSALDASMGIIVVNGTKIKPTLPPNSKQPRSTKEESAKSAKKICNASASVLAAEINLTPMADGEFVWTEAEQTVIYKTFYFGYLVAQVPAGWFSSRFGSKNILAGFLMLGSLSTVMVPLSTSVHYFIVLVVRFVGGIGAGAVFPSIVSLWAKWAPPGERSRLLTISFSGTTTGLVLSYPVAGFLCRYGFDGGWRSIFYIFGGLGCIGSIIWFMFVSDSPLTHPRITKKEKIYIVTALSGETDIQPNTEFHVPWWDLITSLPFLSLAVCHFTCEWALYTLETKVPYYMKGVVKFDVHKDPVIWLLPYIALWLVVLITGVWADKLRTKAVVSTSIVRKVMQCIGTLAPAAFLVTLGFLDCDHVAAAIVFDILAIAFIGFQYSGFLVNHLDIYPKYAGVAIGLCNSIGAASELVAPMLIEVVIKTKEQHEWQMLFMITAAFLIFSCICYSACGSGDLLPWAACEEFDLEELSLKDVSSGSNYDSNGGTSSASDDSSDIISGETKDFSKFISEANALKRETEGEENTEVKTPLVRRVPSDLPNYAIPTPQRENQLGEQMPIQSQPDGPDDVDNILSQYDTLPARGKDRSVSPSPADRAAFTPYIRPFASPYYSNSLDRPASRSRPRSPSPFPALNSSLPHSIASDEPYDSVGGGTLPGYSTRSRNPSPFGGSYASLQTPPSPSYIPPLSRRASRGSARGPSPQLPPQTSLTGLGVSPRQRSMTPTTFPQPESGYIKRPSIDSSAAFEQLEESVV